MKQRINENVCIGTSDVSFKNLLGLKPKLLWTNPNPTSSFQPKDITVSNMNDYDVLGIWYKNSATATKIFEFRGIKSTGIEISFSTTNTNGTALSYQRGIDYVNATTLRVNGCRREYIGYTNENLIPIYIVGYKLGLFD